MKIRFVDDKFIKKFILRQSFSNLLSEEVLNAKKIGLMPDESRRNWFNYMGYWKVINEIINSEDFKKFQYINAGNISKDCEQMQKRKQLADKRVWRIMSFFLWKKVMKISNPKTK